MSEFVFCWWVRRLLEAKKSLLGVSGWNKNGKKENGEVWKRADSDWRHEEQM